MDYSGCRLEITYNKGEILYIPLEPQRRATDHDPLFSQKYVDAPDND